MGGFGNSLMGINFGRVKHVMCACFWGGGGGLGGFLIQKTHDVPGGLGEVVVGLVGLVHVQLVLQFVFMIWCSQSV